MRNGSATVVVGGAGRGDGRTVRPEADRPGARGAPWWFGLGYLVLALLAASVGTMFSITILAMAAPGATGDIALEVATWLLGCLLVGLTGPVAFALAAGVPQRLWRRPGWWAGLVGTTALTLLCVAWLVLVFLFAATGATSMIHNMVLTPLTPIMLVLLLATGLAARALVRAARRAGDV